MESRWLRDNFGISIFMNLLIMLEAVCYWCLCAWMLFHSAKFMLCLHLNLWFPFSEYYTLNCYLIVCFPILCVLSGCLSHLLSAGVFLMQHEQSYWLHYTSSILNNYIGSSGGNALKQWKNSCWFSSTWKKFILFQDSILKNPASFLNT